MIDAVVLVNGDAVGTVMVLDEPVSFWGGFDATTGEIIDQHHPQQGVCLTDTVVFMRSGRGSSSASSVLAEAVRLGTAPAAFVLQHADEILALGALVGAELYGISTPIVLAPADATANVRSGDHVTLRDGKLTHHHSATFTP